MYQQAKNIFSRYLMLFLISMISLKMNAQTIGSWTFNNTLAGTGGTYNTVSAASLSAAVSSPGYYGGTMYYGADWPTSSSINTNYYLEFKLTPNAGYTLQMESINFNMRRGTNTGSGPQKWALRSSLDGFASDIATGTLKPSTSTESVELGTAFTNLLTPVTFRVYGYKASSGGANRFSWDNIVVNGLVLLSAKVAYIQGTVTGNNDITLQWSAENMQDKTTLEIERSYDGNAFTLLNKVENHATIFTYKEDNTGAGLIWYRIKLQEADGTTSYSDVIKLKLNKPASLGISKVIRNGAHLSAQVNAVNSGRGKLFLTSLDGRVVYQQSVELVKGAQSIQLAYNNTNRILILSLVQNDQLASVKFGN